VEKTIGPIVVTFKKPNQIYTINEHSAAISYKIVADVYGRPHRVAKLILGIFCKACKAWLKERGEEQLPAGESKPRLCGWRQQLYP
jgi:hypothetical protein